MPPPRAPRTLVLLLALAGTTAVWLWLSPSLALAGRPVRPAPGAAWRWPLHGEVVGRFAYSRAHAFAAGARRGLDIAAAPGTPVGAACAGRVTFAGRVPAGGRAVTVRCGALVATHLGLIRVDVRRGALVAPGVRLGALGPSGRLRLGARRASDRFGYVDPERLVRDGAGPVPGVPLGRAPRRPARPGPVQAPRPLTRALRRPFAPVAERPAPARIPAVAWGGLVLLAAGVPIGGLVRRSRGRRARRVLEPVATAERL